MTRITVYLEEAERAGLDHIAQIERRPIRDQAALLIREGLERAGLLPQVTRSAVIVKATTNTVGAIDQEA